MTDNDIDTMMTVLFEVFGPGCRITIDGTVVSEQAQGGSAHCIWTA